jgi:SAM-dependent methyltransferase
MTSPRYDQEFFEYVNSGASRSARKLLPLLSDLRVSSVLDVGCGQGAWLSVWQELGVDETVGVDGEYVDTNYLKISAKQFVVADLRKEFDLGRKFDFVQCLEVAEHLPASSAESLVRGLTRHGDIVLFSAAAKGQGGEDHINEQPYEYWRRIFREYDFVPLDCLRTKILEDQSVEPWYRYNSFLYVRRSKLGSVPEALSASLVEEDETLRDLSPVIYKVRKVIVRMLPVFIVSALSRFRISLLLRHRQIGK